MKTYSLFEFLTQPISILLDNEEDYCYQDLHSTDEKLTTGLDSISKITIPIIQRDYVQGHPENTELLTNFIEVLFAALEKETKLKLDFIYGSLDRKKNNVFLPLDGQQRLTTLFLLHWYIIKKEASNEDFRNIYLPILNKFTYETRDTSRRFFIELISFDFKDKPGTEVQKSYWFTKHFALDPTVKACINALEVIDKVYKLSDKKGSLLKNLHKGYIVFYVLPMEQFSLTDDLYIKLNARGKVLSSFENFKADLIGYMNTIPSFSIALENEEKLSKADIIAAKFDNDWSNLFWKIARENEKENRAIDNYFFRFIHKVLINNFILKHSVGDINKDKTYTELLKKERELTYNTFEFYNKENLVDEQFIIDLETLLDGYLQYEAFISKCVKPLWDPAFEWSIYLETYTMNQRMVFDAVNQFILNGGCTDFEEQLFQNWMRISWNILAEPTNRNIETNKTAMRSIRSIAPFAADIYVALAEGNLDVTIDTLNQVFAGQLVEERTKARFLIQSDNGPWQDAIHNAESHRLFSGNIGFLLQEIDTPEQLNARYATAQKLFNNSGTVKLFEHQNYSLLRYVIAKITNWNTLTKFSYLSNEDNWMANLRRNEHLKRTLQQLIELNDFPIILDEIKNGVREESKLEGDSERKRLAHQNMYLDNEFHRWIQKQKTGNIDFRYGRIFVFRPSAWYDKVMIDGYRNEFTQALINYFNITEMHNRCDQTNYFWYEWYDCFKTIGDRSVTFNFDTSNHVHIGLWAERNKHIGNPNNRSDGWIEIHTFNLDEIKSVENISTLLKKIEDTITSDDNSLIKDLLEDVNPTKVNYDNTPEIV